MKSLFMFCGVYYYYYIIVYHGMLSVYMVAFTRSKWEVHHIHSDRMNAALVTQSLLLRCNITMYIYHVTIPRGLVTRLV